MNYFVQQNNKKVKQNCLYEDIFDQIASFTKSETSQGLKTGAHGYKLSVYYTI